MPPVAMIGTDNLSASRGTSAKRPDHLALGGGRIEGAAMAAGFETLRHHRVGAGRLGGARLGEGRRAGEPGDAARLQLGDESRRETAP